MYCSKCGYELMDNTVFCPMFVKPAAETSDVVNTGSPKYNDAENNAMMALEHNGTGNNDLEKLYQVKDFVQAYYPLCDIRRTSKENLSSEKYFIEESKESPKKLIIALSFFGVSLLVSIILGVIGTVNLGAILFLTLARIAFGIVTFACGITAVIYLINLIKLKSAYHNDEKNMVKLTRMNQDVGQAQAAIDEFLSNPIRYRQSQLFVELFPRGVLLEQLNEMIYLIETHRALDFQQALNLYDENQHRLRMEGYIQQTATFSQQAAYAAEQAAAYGERISRNTYMNIMKT